MDDKTAIAKLLVMRESGYASERDVCEHAIQAIEALAKANKRIAELQSQIEDEVAMRDMAEAAQVFDPAKVRELLEAAEALVEADEKQEMSFGYVRRVSLAAKAVRESEGK